MSPRSTHRAAAAAAGLAVCLSISMLPVVGAATAAAAVDRCRHGADLLTEVAEDPTAYLAEDCQVLYVDPLDEHTSDLLGHDHASHEKATTHARAGDQVADQTALLAAAGPAGGYVPSATEVFTLASRPGADRTLYLDFDGAELTDTAWNKSPSTPDIAPAFTLDSNASTFNDFEREAIYDAWVRMSADYETFDLNVTTAAPPAAALHRDHEFDPTYGTTMVFTTGYRGLDWCLCTGMAYNGVFGSTADFQDKYSSGIVLADDLGGMTAKWSIGALLSDLGSHEAGHQFGLSHDGHDSDEYYGGDTYWAPIMGSSGLKTLSQFSRGDYTGATNRQDDLAIIAESAPALLDDHGDLGKPTATTANGSYTGRIGLVDDIDAFAFTTTGPTTVSATPQSYHTNLDARLQILDASGRTIVDANPGSGWAGGTRDDHTFGVAADAYIPSAGRYFAVVSGGVVRTTMRTVATSYGSIGNYYLTIAPGGSGPSGPTVPPPTTPPRSKGGPDPVGTHFRRWTSQ